MKIEPVRTLTSQTDLVDVAFLDEEALLFTTPSAELRRMVSTSEIPVAEIVWGADQILGPAARALGATTMSPASGGYPRLSVSSSAGVAVVNTHDRVLLACPLHGQGPPRIVSLGWGQYYPRLSFSADGARFMASSDELLLFDTRSWRSYQAPGDVSACVWHPREPRLLCLAATTGHLHWLDVRDLGNPRFEPIGKLPPASWDDDVAGIAMDASGELLVVAHRSPGRLERWRLDTLHREDTRRSLSGDIVSLESGRETGLLAAVTDGGVELRNLQSLEPIADVIPDVSAIALSPSARRFVTICHETTDPYPAEPARRGRAPALWRVVG